jgi:hypothetical protein
MHIHDVINIKSNNKDVGVKQNNISYGHFNDHNLFIADNGLIFLEMHKFFNQAYMKSECNNIWVYSGL